MPSIYRVVHTASLQLSERTQNQLELSEFTYNIEFDVKMENPLEAVTAKTCTQLVTDILESDVRVKQLDFDSLVELTIALYRHESEYYKSQYFFKEVCDALLCV